jgi:hypothetical protein
MRYRFEALQADGRPISGQDEAESPRGGTATRCSALCNDAGPN